MSEENGDLGEGVTGSGRFRRKPRATLARLAETAQRDDVKLPTQDEIDELISYLSMSKQVGGLTYKQMDAFWELNRQLVDAHDELRDYYRARPAYEFPEHLEVPSEKVASKWLHSLDDDRHDLVCQAAYVQFKAAFEEEDELARTRAP